MQRILCMDERGIMHVDGSECTERMHGTNVELAFLTLVAKGLVLRATNYSYES